MPKFGILFSKNAQLQIAKLDVVTRKRFGRKLLYFADSGRPLAFSKRLIGITPPVYRFRIGKYRVFFEIDGNMLNILAVKLRDNAYRKLL